MASMTVRYARHRAASDPDRDTCRHGRYYGNNLPGVYSHTGVWLLRMRVTRGAWHKRVGD